MDPRKKEIRKILAGYYADDSCAITAAPDLIRVSFFGSVMTGAFSAYLFGLKTGVKQFKADYSVKECRSDCQNAFFKLGRRVVLQTAPDALAVLSFPLFHNPCIMTADFSGSRFLLTFYTSRTPMAFLNAIRGFRKWKKLMPMEKLKKEEVTIEPVVSLEKK